MDPRIEELRLALATERSNCTGRRWRATDSLRARVVAAVALGVHINLLRRWLRRPASQSPAAPAFHPVTLRARDLPRTSGLVLVTPGGCRLEGLDLPTALTLLQTLP